MLPELSRVEGSPLATPNQSDFRILRTATKNLLSIFVGAQVDDFRRRRRRGLNLCLIKKRHGVSLVAGPSALAGFAAPAAFATSSSRGSGVVRGCLNY